MRYDAWRLYFERVIELPDAEINLAEGALILAADEYPDLDVSHYLARVESLAATCAPRIEGVRDPRACIEALNAFLFEERGFTGNRRAYYDPRNSYLNAVLERRLGIPISLSVLVIAIARRLGLPIVGVGLPGHFCVKWQDAANEIVFDPFNRGAILDIPAILARVRETAQPHATFEPDWLDAVGNKYILYRMLNNLKSLYMQRGQLRRAQQAVDKLLLLDPRASGEIREMGLLSLRLGEHRRAVMYLEQYLLSHPDAYDADEIRALLTGALEQVERLN